jgi:predicted MFS family arabinose efflux permease
MPGLLTLTLGTFVAVTTEMLPVGLLPLIGEEFLITESQAGLLVSLYAVMVAVLAVPLTLITARMARKPLLLVCLACYGLSNLLVTVAPDLTTMAAGRLMGGLAHSLFFSVCIGYAARLVTADLTGRALAIASAGVSIGFVLGVPLGVSLGSIAGWRGAFIAVTACTAAALLLAVWLLPPAPPSAMVSALRRERLGRLTTVLASNALTYLGHYLLYTYVTVLLLGAGVSVYAVGALLLVLGGIGLASLLFASRHFDSHLRLSALAIVGTMVIGMAGAAALYPALLATALACAVWNAGFGAVSPLYQAAAVRTAAVSPDMAGAWINATCNAGIALGAALGGQLLDVLGIPAVAWTASGLTLAALLVVVLARRSFANGSRA